MHVQCQNCLHRLLWRSHLTSCCVWGCLVADSKDSGTGSSEDGDRPTHHRLDLLDRGQCGGGGPGAGGGGLDTGSEWSESRPDSPECLFERPSHLLHPAYHPRLLGTNPSSAPSPPPPGGASGSNPSKPRIWSLADMASKDSDVHHLTTPVPTSAFYSAAVAAGKLISPLANRGPLHPHHLHPSVHHPAGSYARPTHHDFYRSFYGPATHLAGAGGGSAGDVSLLETYSRTFGAGLSTGGSPAGAPGAGMTPLSSVLSKAAVAAVAAASGAGTPFALNGGVGTLGLAPASSGASSSSSVGSGTEQHAPPQDVGKLQQAQLNKAWPQVQPNKGPPRWGTVRHGDRGPNRHSHCSRCSPLGALPTTGDKVMSEKDL